MRSQQVERASYEAELAQRRYLRVDPDNRLAADSLEHDWNHRLRALGAAQEDYERQRKSDGATLSDERRAVVMSMATDFPRLWRDPQTEMRERKRMVRLMVKDVSLIRGERITSFAVMPPEALNWLVPCGPGSYVRPTLRSSPK